MPIEGRNYFLMKITNQLSPSVSMSFRNCEDQMHIDHNIILIYIQRFKIFDKLIKKNKKLSSLIVHGF